MPEADTWQTFTWQKQVLNVSGLPEVACSLTSGGNLANPNSV